VAFLRFTRDKRGYEQFALVHPTTNRRGATRQRVLYVYRTPPDVKVGREPFDEAVRRALETQYPDVSFDWPKILETPIPSADAERWRERRRAERAAKQAASAEAAAEAAAEAGADDAAEETETLDAPEPPTAPAVAAVTDLPVQTDPPATTAPGSPARRRRRRRGRRGRPDGPIAAPGTPTGDGTAPGLVPEDNRPAAPTDDPLETDEADAPVESTGE